MLEKICVFLGCSRKMGLWDIIGGKTSRPVTGAPSRSGPGGLGAEVRTVLGGKPGVAGLSRVAVNAFGSEVCRSFILFRGHYLIILLMGQICHYMDQHASGSCQRYDSISGGRVHAIQQWSNNRQTGSRTSLA